MNNVTWAPSVCLAHCCVPVSQVNNRTATKCWWRRQLLTLMIPTRHHNSCAVFTVFISQTFSYAASYTCCDCNSHLRLFINFINSVNITTLFSCTFSAVSEIVWWQHFLLFHRRSHCVYTVYICYHNCVRHLSAEDRNSTGKNWLLTLYMRRSLKNSTNNCVTQ